MVKKKKYHQKKIREIFSELVFQRDENGDDENDGDVDERKDEGAEERENDDGDDAGCMKISAEDDVRRKPCRKLE